MRDWGSMEDYTGMAYIREQVPAENDVFKKMKPEWGKLYYSNGELLYEGFMVDGMAYGAGTSYYHYGHPCQEGLWGPNGLICGREYYCDGQLRFEGTYQYNAGFGVNWPIFGAFYDHAGKLQYYGAFDVVQESEYSVRPYVVQPAGYGPVMKLIWDRNKEYRFTGNKARRFFREESPEYKSKFVKKEKEAIRTMYGEDKIAARIRKYVASIYPEERSFAEEELKQMGKWTSEDEQVLMEKEREAESSGHLLSPKERYVRDRQYLRVPALCYQDFAAETKGREVTDDDYTKFCSQIESMYPYRWRMDPRHKRIGRSLVERRVNPRNWLQHLDEMSDMEISYMLEQEPGIGRLNEERMARPDVTDRQYAEGMRDFGF